ncbi:MAG: CPBP family glutamic-type intramembrane protease [Bacteroidia bacterium]|nr:CPBP family glutamic-type intramembrane protease [Bacteroidia bacterium]MDW8089699.1 CPBP family glutamic-type intramembrane protease [Bacteroidia bacterium]
MRAYWRASLSPAYNFFLAIFLLVGYEGLMYALGGAPTSTRNLVDQWLTRLLGWTKPYQWVVSLLIVLLGLAYVYGIRRDTSTLTEWVFLVMLVEAAAWAVVLYKFLPLLTAHVLPPAAQLSLLLSEDFWLGLAQCLGAGFYEELFFRVLLVEALRLLLTGFSSTKATALHTAVVWCISAILFSLAHFLYEPFRAYAFWYRALFGLFMSGLYILRGFAITAWAHALYDMYVLWWA